MKFDIDVKKQKDGYMIENSGVFLKLEKKKEEFWKG